MDSLLWVLIGICFAIAFIGLVYPIIPSVLFIIAGIFMYGLFFSFAPFTPIFWIIQILLVILLFFADYIMNLIGIKKYGGSKAGIWGSTIGLLVGPFVIPFVGIVIGPFLGAIIAELVFQRQSIDRAIKIGVGSVIGFIGSTLTKIIIFIFMITYFIVTIF